MKTRYWAIGIAALFILCAAAGLYLFRAQPAARYASIYSGGALVRTVALSEDTSFTVTAADGGSNTITVSGGRIAVTAATCPDGICMARGACDSGPEIVCLPNALVIRFSDDGGVDGALG